MFIIGSMINVRGVDSKLLEGKKREKKKDRYIYIYVDKIEKERGNVRDPFAKRGEVFDSKTYFLFPRIFFLPSYRLI